MSITVILLDATYQVPVKMDSWQQVEADKHTPQIEFINTVMSNSTGFIQSGGGHVRDLLAEVIMVKVDLWPLVQSSQACRIRPILGGRVVPGTARLEDIQNPIEYLPVVVARSASFPLVLRYLAVPAPSIVYRLSCVTSCSQFSLNRPF